MELAISSNQALNFAGHVCNQNLCRWHLMKLLKRRLYEASPNDFYKKGIKLFKKYYWSKTEYQMMQNETQFKDHCLSNAKFKTNKLSVAYLEKLLAKKMKYVDYYVKQQFTGGYNSTQRNESIHGARILMQLS